MPISKPAGLSLSWRAFRLAMLIIVMAICGLILIGSQIPWIRPSCCAVEMGISCSSCGITRSMIMLLHGDVERALAIHPGGVGLAIVLLGSLLLRPLPYLLPSPGMILADFLVVILSWILVACYAFGLPGSGYHIVPVSQSSCRVKATGLPENRSDEQELHRGGSRASSGNPGS